MPPSIVRLRVNPSVEGIAPSTRHPFLTFLTQATLTGPPDAFDACLPDIVSILRENGIVISVDRPVSPTARVLPVRDAARRVGLAP